MGTITAPMTELLCWRPIWTMFLFWKSVIVTGTGNEGNARIHVSGRILQSGTGIYPPQNIPFSVGEYETGLSIQIWKSYTDQMDFRGVTLTEPLSGPFQEILGTQRFTLGNTDLLVYYGTPSPYSTSQEIYLDFIPKIPISIPESGRSFSFRRKSSWEIMTSGFPGRAF
ncbi:MAG: hypothetical protein V8R80_02650 [Eubacterium sp.]